MGLTNVNGKVCVGKEDVLAANQHFPTQVFLVALCQLRTLWDQLCRWPNSGLRSFALVQPGKNMVKRVVGKLHMSWYQHSCQLGQFWKATSMTSGLLFVPKLWSSNKKHRVFACFAAAPYPVPLSTAYVIVPFGCFTKSMYGGKLFRHDAPLQVLIASFPFLPCTCT